MTLCCGRTTSIVVMESSVASVSEGRIELVMVDVVVGG